jgi:hypothetical protein
MLVVVSRAKPIVVTHFTTIPLLAVVVRSSKSMPTTKIPVIALITVCTLVIYLCPHDNHITASHSIHRANISWGVLVLINIVNSNQPNLLSFAKIVCNCLYLIVCASMKPLGRMINMYFCLCQNIKCQCRRLFYKLVNIIRCHFQSIGMYFLTEKYLPPSLNPVAVNSYVSAVKQLCIVCLAQYEYISLIKMCDSERSSRVSVIFKLSFHLSPKRSIENFTKCAVKRYCP